MKEKGCEVVEHRLITKCPKLEECVKNNCYKKLRNDRKISFLENNYVYKTTTLLREIQNQQHVYKLGLAPKIIDYYKSGKNYHFITENLNNKDYYTINDLYKLKKISSTNLYKGLYIEHYTNKKKEYLLITDKQTNNGQTIINGKYKAIGSYNTCKNIPTKKDIENIYNAIKKLFDGGIYHGDLNGGNIMYNTKTEKVLFIDFEFSHMSMIPIFGERFSQLLKFKDYMVGDWNCNIIGEIGGIPEIFIIMFYNLSYGARKITINKYIEKFKTEIPNHKEIIKFINRFNYE
jgi:hypothetical protein